MASASCEEIYAFPKINVTESLKEIDLYTKDTLRAMKTGKHNKANLVIAGHMSSDSLGFNQILDAWEAKGIEIVRINGII